MKAEDKNPLQRVRIAVLGNVNVGKSGELLFLLFFLFFFLLLFLHILLLKISEFF